MIGGVSYRERATALPGVVLWERAVAPGSERGLIMPDGCMDLIWDGCRLFVAGPDSTARWHESRPATRYTGLRFSGGVGPALVGVRADEMLDVSADVEALWPSRLVQDLVERVSVTPAEALERWTIQRFNSSTIDPLGRRVLALSDDGLPIAVIAERCGLSSRQLHRRCLSLFGYGPRRLGRVRRMNRAVDAARAGASLAGVAAASGYADQAHLCREIRDLTGSSPTGLLRHLSLREMRE
jgi:AraC-like DNA-binding protein